MVLENCEIPSSSYGVAAAHTDLLEVKPVNASARIGKDFLSSSLIARSYCQLMAAEVGRVVFFGDVATCRLPMPPWMFPHHAHIVNTS